MNKQHVAEILDTPTTFNTAVNKLKHALLDYDRFYPVQISDELSDIEQLNIERVLENFLASFYKKRRKAVYEAAVNLVNYYEQHDGGA